MDGHSVVLWVNKQGFKITRDGVLFLAGLAGVAHQTLLSEIDRPMLLTVFAGMMGLPAFLRMDEKREEKK